MIPNKTVFVLKVEGIYWNWLTPNWILHPVLELKLLELLKTNYFQWPTYENSESTLKQPEAREKLQLNFGYPGVNFSMLTPIISPRPPDKLKQRTGWPVLMKLDAWRVWTFLLVHLSTGIIDKIWKKKREFRCYVARQKHPIGEVKTKSIGCSPCIILGDKKYKFWSNRVLLWDNTEISLKGNLNGDYIYSMNGWIFWSSLNRRKTYVYYSDKRRVTVSKNSLYGRIIPNLAAFKRANPGIMLLQDGTLYHSARQTINNTHGVGIVSIWWLISPPDLNLMEKTCDIMKNFPYYSLSQLDGRNRQLIAKVWVIKNLSGLINFRRTLESDGTHSTQISTSQEKDTPSIEIEEENPYFICRLANFKQWTLIFSTFDTDSEKKNKTWEYMARDCLPYKIGQFISSLRPFFFFFFGRTKPQSYLSTI